MPKNPKPVRSGARSVKSLVSTVANLGEKLVTEVGKVAAGTVFIPKPPIGLTSPFVLHSQESMVIHQGPVLVGAIAGQKIRTTTLPLALISMNRSGVYRTPLLKSMVQLELLSGALAVQRSNGATIALSKGVPVSFPTPVTDSLILTVAGSGFAQILVVGGKKGVPPLDPRVKPVVGGSLNEPVIDE